MKRILLHFFFTLSIWNINAQQFYSDSLKNVFQSAKQDSTKVSALTKLSYYYSLLYPDSALYYADEIIELSKKSNYTQGEVAGLISKAEALDRFASYPEALKAAYNALEISKKLSEHRLYMMGLSYGSIAHLNAITGNHKEGIAFYHQANNLIEESGEYKQEIYFSYFSMAFSMWQLRQMDSALFYIKKGEELFTAIREKRNPSPWLIMGNIYNSTGDVTKAENYFREGLRLSEEFNALFLTAVLYNSLAEISLQKKEKDSSVYYAKKSLTLSQRYNYNLFKIGASGFLAYNIYDGVNADSALKYMKIMTDANNEVFNSGRGQQFQQVSFDAEKREKELEEAKKQFQNKIRLYVFIIAVTFFIMVAIIFWRNSSQKKKANILLSDQKERLESTLEDLKATQKQLIQSEKMASLGELTAGIAHEIQNPLNFVNNFSEVNKELISEMKEEIEKGNYGDVQAIANDIEENEEKINHHGKRADAIVKGMLQHSRSSTGQKERTDINALVDEYLRLSYHGLRAKDKSFNATMKTDFDETIGKVNIMPQDMGRVLLNLFTNAFYVVAEKNASAKELGQQYEPTVFVSTKKVANNVEIKVKDNGDGVPQKVLDKIFQPFFTTKPTGQGTGLGLSLSYDIVKAHDGEIKVETKEGEGAIFIILLPA